VCLDRGCLGVLRVCLGSRGGVGLGVGFGRGGGGRGGPSDEMESPGCRPCPCRMALEPRTPADRAAQDSTENKKQGKTKNNTKGLVGLSLPALPR